jgi:iron complex outermembrane receptor protein
MPSPLAHSLGYGPLTFDFFSQELRLNGAFGANDEVEYTIGAFYSDQKSVYTSFQDLRSSALEFQQSDPVNADSKALFAHVSWTPIDRLTLNGGIRYTEEAKTYQYIRQRPYNDPDFDHRQRGVAAERHDRRIFRVTGSITGPTSNMPGPMT